MAAVRRTYEPLAGTSIAGNGARGRYVFEMLTYVPQRRAPINARGTKRLERSISKSELASPGES